MEANESLMQEEELVIKEEKVKWFRILGRVSCVYALLFTVCLYRNFNGITMPIWIVGTLGSVFYVMRELKMSRKKDGDYMIVFMLLLGISTILTGNGYIVFMNYVLYFLLLVSWLLHQFQEDAGWTLTEQLGKILEAVFRALECIDKPFFEGSAYYKYTKKENNEKRMKVLSGVLLAIPVLFLLGVLLVSADAVFKNCMESVLGGITVSNEGILIPLFIVFGFLSFYCGIHSVHLGSCKNFIPKKEAKDATMYIAFTGSITLLYLAFSMIQIIYLFAGLGSLPEGMTYAEYARTGFFQLLFVSVLNLLLILVLQTKVKKNQILTGILTTICFCTLIMIASSFYRMILYIEAYHLSFLRVFVLVSLVVITLLILGATITLYFEGFALTQFSIIVVSAVYLIFSFSHVDYFIAKYNLAHMTKDTEYETLYYIGALSSDAAPVIADYIKDQPELVEGYLKDYRMGKELIYEDTMMESDWLYYYLLDMEQIRERMGIRTFNFSYYKAIQSLK